MVDDVSTNDSEIALTTTDHSTIVKSNVVIDREFSQKSKGNNKSKELDRILPRRLTRYINCIVSSRECYPRDNRITRYYPISKVAVVATGSKVRSQVVNTAITMLTCPQVQAMPATSDIASCEIKNCYCLGVHGNLRLVT